MQLIINNQLNLKDMVVIKKIKFDLSNGNSVGLEELLSKVYSGEAGVCDLADFAEMKIEFKSKK